MPHDIAHHSMRRAPLYYIQGLRGHTWCATKRAKMVNLLLNKALRAKKAIPVKFPASSIHYQCMHTLKELPLQMWKRGLWVNHRANQKECAQIWAFRPDWQSYAQL